MNRLNQIKSHLTSAQGLEKAQQKTPSDVVIVAAYRTALTKAGKGAFKDINSDEILVKLFKALWERLPNFDKSTIQDVVVGNVLNPGAGANEHRAAMLAADMPCEVPFLAVNRQCSSGLVAVNDVANKILSGQIECGLAAGVESMSFNYGPQAAPKISKSVLKENHARDCLIPMGITNENVAEEYHITRDEMDIFAAGSYQKAEKAVKQGLFKDEILEVEVEVEDEVEENEEENEEEKQPNLTKRVIKVSQDEGVRPGVSAQSLGKIKPAFKKNGTTHAGNASQITDGAAVVLLMTREKAQSLHLPILGKYVSTQVVGVPPHIMGVGPAYAIPRLLDHLQVPLEAVKVFEINEAFAGQALYCIRKVGIPEEKVNPRGGAIALGHPLGATGARQIATLLRQLSPGEIGVTSMCVGTGMGAAALFVKE